MKKIVLMLLPFLFAIGITSVSAQTDCFKPEIILTEGDSIIDLKGSPYSSAVRLKLNKPENCEVVDRYEYESVKLTWGRGRTILSQNEYHGYGESVMSALRANGVQPGDRIGIELIKPVAISKKGQKKAIWVKPVGWLIK